MAKLKKFEIEWSEDSNKEFENIFEDDSSKKEIEFTELLEGEEPNFEERSFQVGDKVKGRIIQITSREDVFVDIGSKIPATIAKRDLLDEASQQLTKKEGDTVEAFIVSKTMDSLVLSNSLSHKVARASALEDAWRSGLPVIAKVVAVNKGGYELETMGQKGFCPLSQMESFYVEKPDEYVGKQFEFLVNSFSKKQCLLSRRGLLERKAKEKLITLFENLEAGPIVTGVITSLKDFGASVLIDGCLNAFLHISEVSFGHVEKISDFLEVGQTITAKVVDITGDFSAERLPKVSLSLKACENDPWETVSKDFPTGGTYKAKITRLAPFGAFASLKPGIEGLIHISEMSWVKRVRKPEEILALGDIVSVRLLEMDPFKKKMSLSLKAIDEDPWLKVSQDFKVGSSHNVAVLQLKSFGAICVLEEGVTGLLPRGDLQKKFGQSYRKNASPPHKLDVVVKNIDQETKKILLGFSGLEEDDDSREDFKEYLAASGKSSPDINDSFGSSSSSSSKDESTFSLASLLGDALKKK